MILTLRSDTKLRQAGGELMTIWWTWSVDEWECPVRIKII